MTESVQISAELPTDSVTSLPHYLSLLSILEKRLREDGSLGLLVINVHGLESIEEAQGSDTYDEILLEISAALNRMQGTIVRYDDLMAVADLAASSFLIFLSESRRENETDHLEKKDIEVIAARVEDFLHPLISSVLSRYTKDQAKLAIGFAQIVDNPLVRPQRLITRLMDEAREMARLHKPISKARNKERLQKIILQEDVSTVFQPIYNLDDGSIMGYEALTRGPRGTALESPLQLFAIARESNLIVELDRLCRRKALINSRLLPKNCKIFINTLPNTIHDPEFRGKFLETFLQDVKQPPENIVFEINERVAIENFSAFREAIRYYTDIGMSIAVDDTGTGYSTLEAIVELHPHYLKFDMSMVKGIGKNPLKQEMLKMLYALAAKINSTVIAEGIEEKEDLEMLKQLGIKIGQGFYFSRPLTVTELTTIQS